MHLSEEAQIAANRAAAVLIQYGILDLMNYDPADPKNAPLQSAKIQQEIWRK